MQVTQLQPSGLVLIQLTIHRDERGFFLERFQQERFRDHGLPISFCQDNHSRSLPGVLRGLHYQRHPPQGKLIGVVRGRIWDVAVDVRLDSPTLGQRLEIELNESAGRLLWVPPGFAHGFCVLGDEPADVLYKVDAPYNAAGESGLHWADPDLNIAWPIRNPRLSARDQALPSFASYTMPMS